MANAAQGTSAAHLDEGLAEETAENIEQLSELIQDDFILQLVAAGVVLMVTAIAAHLVTGFIRRLLQHEGSVIPANSIFINIVKVAVWVFGLSFMFSFCFGQDVTGLFTALGIGGLAISLGAQDTISNLIGGLNMSLSGLVKPGEKVRMGTTDGVVQDVTWRHTTIVDEVGNTIIVPNSVVNTSSLVKTAPVTTVIIPVVVTASDDRLTVVAHRMEKAAGTAVARVCKVKRAPAILFTEVTDYGYRGTMSFIIGDATKVRPARDAAVRAIAQYAHGDLSALHASQGEGAAVAALPAQGAAAAGERASQSEGALLSEGSAAEGFTQGEGTA